MQLLRMSRKQDYLISANRFAGQNLDAIRFCRKFEITRVRNLLNITRLECFIWRGSRKFKTSELLFTALINVELNLNLGESKRWK